MPIFKVLQQGCLELGSGLEDLASALEVVIIEAGRLEALFEESLVLALGRSLLCQSSQRLLILLLHRRFELLQIWRLNLGNVVENCLKSERLQRERSISGLLRGVLVEW